MRKIKKIKITNNFNKNKKINCFKFMQYSTDKKIIMKV